MSGGQDPLAQRHQRHSRQARKSSVKPEDPWVPQRTQARGHVPTQSTVTHSLQPRSQAASRSLSPRPLSTSYSLSPRSQGTSRSLSPEPRSKDPKGSVFFNTIKAKNRQKLLKETTTTTTTGASTGSPAKADLGDVVLYLQ
ncbi:hypothetical protein OTU49_000932, partial [Cherax quadricarinatus]